MILLSALVVVFAQVGNPIVTPPAPVPSSNTINVNVTPRDPDPQATAAMYGFILGNTERDHAAVPVSWASGLLSGANIWTTTPWSHFELPALGLLRNVARSTAMSLFVLGVIWTGLQLAYGSGTGTSTYQQLLPLMIVGFFVAFYSDTIAHRAIDLNNWICERLGNPSLADFSELPLTLPPSLEPETPGAVRVPAGFAEGVIGAVVYAVVLIVLELKMIFREAVLFVMYVVMPFSGVLWAFAITRGWGVQLFRLFFGSLFSQPLVVICLAIGGSLLTLMNLTDPGAQFLVKLAVLFLAIKMVTFLSGASISGGAMFGLAGILLLLRRSASAARRASASGGGGSSPAPTPIPVAGSAGGTGAGSAATGRPWRPAPGMA